MAWYKKDTFGVYDEGVPVGLKKKAEQTVQPFSFIGEIELSVNFCHVGNQIEYFVRITDFVVIPRNDFTNVSVRAIPAFASKIEVRVSPKKSEDTTASSV